MAGKKVAKMELLLQGTVISYYWMGLLLADGCLTKKGELRLTLANKDASHVRRFAKFIEFTGTYQRSDAGLEGAIGIRTMNRHVANTLRKQFGFHFNKTLHPCDLSKIPKGDELFSFIVGFMDGDACIHKPKGRRQVVLSMKGHASWVENFSTFSEYLTRYRWDTRPIPAPTVNKQGYAQLLIGNTAILSGMKRKVVALELPIMKRKWEKVPMEYIGKNQIAAMRINSVKKFLLEGCSTSEIADLLEVTRGTVSLIIRRNELRK